uniref:Uncharacterized protein LOC101505928 n=1 Tax=Cicer arietinum TaxID=3827 RepID=A0A1S2YTA5_CICAR|nr:uncharacterized protein LOC101505928 [Cicer arietinum]
MKLVASFSSSSSHHFFHLDGIFRFEEIMVKNRSSVSTSNGVKPPLCGCKQVMRMWMANTPKNPKRKFWKCKNYGSEQSCHLFVWDDDRNLHNGNQNPSTVAAGPVSADTVALDHVAPACNNCDMMKSFMMNNSRDVDKLKKKLESEKKKKIWLVIALIMSWIYFTIFYKN